MAETERVIVTGTNIPTAETEPALPVVIYSGEMLQKQGANTPAEGLRQLPSFVGNTATENDSNGGDGQARINLRALGDGNTLTLINGRRGFENINAIPIGALMRTEVLKDGASAIYGSDAVAGVVNFILLNGPGETPFEGAEINLLYGNTTDHDARVLQGYVRGGIATPKFAIAAMAEYYDRDDIYSRDRETSKSPDVRKLGGANGGSSLFSGVVTLAPERGGRQVLIDLSNNAPLLLLTGHSIRRDSAPTPRDSISAPSPPRFRGKRNTNITSPPVTTYSGGSADLRRPVLCQD